MFLNALKFVISSTWHHRRAPQEPKPRDKDGTASVSRRRSCGTALARFAGDMLSCSRGALRISYSAVSSNVGFAQNANNASRQSIKLLQVWGCMFASPGAARSNVERPVHRRAGLPECATSATSLQRNAEECGSGRNVTAVQRPAVDRLESRRKQVPVGSGQRESVTGHANSAQGSGIECGGRAKRLAHARGAGAPDHRRAQD